MFKLLKYYFKICGGDFKKIFDLRMVSLSKIVGTPYNVIITNIKMNDLLKPLMSPRKALKMEKI